MRRTIRRRWRAGTARRSRPARPSTWSATWPDRIRAVTADAVRDAARNWLDRRASVTGYLVNSLHAEEKHT